MSAPALSTSQPELDVANMGSILDLQPGFNNFRGIKGPRWLRVELVGFPGIWVPSGGIGEYAEVNALVALLVKDRSRFIFSTTSETKSVS
jgi:hypothetical protein